LVSSNLFRC